MSDTFIPVSWDQFCDQVRSLRSGKATWRSRKDGMVFATLEDVEVFEDEIYLEFSDVTLRVNGRPVSYSGAEYKRMDFSRNAEVTQRNEVFFIEEDERTLQLRPVENARGTRHQEMSRQLMATMVEDGELQEQHMDDLEAGNT